MYTLWIVQNDKALQQRFAGRFKAIQPAMEKAMSVYDLCYKCYVTYDGRQVWRNW